ncbi:MAG: mechanosensitive ion channel family protein [Kiritimatiellae bacterium]|nr:mechanosensitive ion channel family protein [Kiritimatiellia bacterium]
MWRIWAKETVVGIEVWRVLLFFGIVLVSLAVGRLAQYFMSVSVKRARTDRKTLVVVILEALARPAMFVACTVGWRLGVTALGDISKGVGDVVSTISAVLTAAAIGYTFYRLVDVVDYYLTRFAKSTESKVDDMLVPLVGKSVRVTVLVLVIIDVIQTLSTKPVTSILAGLGVGGLAIALAGQDTIKNFFGSIVIVADKPFEIGDRIVIDGHDGPVESVGFRSTKIRTLAGHLVTVPNAEIVNKTVQNIGKRPYIKRVMNVTVTYDTAPEKMQRAVDIISEILVGHEGMSPDSPPRVFFSDFNDWSLNILVIYWYYPPDYWKYMEFSAKVNMQILERFNEEGIEFAFPTQTICMADTA